MTTAAFHTSRRIDFVDTDMAGIVHFSNFFRFMETAEVEFLRARGLTVALVWEGQKIGFPRVSATCDYLRPARFGDVLEISVRIKNIGKKSITYSFDFACNSEPTARGEVSCVCCRVLDEHHLESMEIPASISERLRE